MNEFLRQASRERVAPQGAAGIWLFETQFRAHHEIQPDFGLAVECADYGLTFLLGKPIGLKYVHDR